MINFGKAVTRPLTRLWRWAFGCRHDWDVTACNGFGTPIEEQCETCCVYQHRILKAETMHEPPEWVPGPYPNRTREITFTN